MPVAQCYGWLWCPCCELGQEQVGDTRLIRIGVHIDVGESQMPNASVENVRVLGGLATTAMGVDLAASMARPLLFLC